METYEKLRPRHTRTRRRGATESLVCTWPNSACFHCSLLVFILGYMALNFHSCSVMRLKQHNYDVIVSSWSIHIVVVPFFC